MKTRHIHACAHLNRVVLQQCDGLVEVVEQEKSGDGREGSLQYSQQLSRSRVPDQKLGVAPGHDEAIVKKKAGSGE